MISINKYYRNLEYDYKDKDKIVVSTNKKKKNNNIIIK